MAVAFWKLKGVNPVTMWSESNYDFDLKRIRQREYKKELWLRKKELRIKKESIIFDQLKL